MKNLFDQFSKTVATLALERGGACQSAMEISHAPLDAQQADLYFVPDDKRKAELLNFGLLGRMAKERCLIEPFSRPPGVEATLECLRKALNLRRQLERKQKMKALSLTRPMLWIVSGGDPETLVRDLAFEPLYGWPDGTYEMPEQLRTRLVIVPELPDLPDTLYLRLMGQKDVLDRALWELYQSKSGSVERDELLPALLQYIQVIRGRSIEERTDELEALVESAKNIVQEIEQRGELRGLVRGRAESLLEQLEARFGPLSAQMKAQVEEADIELLKVYGKRVLSAKTIEEVLAGH